MIWIRDKYVVHMFSVAYTVTLVLTLWAVPHTRLFRQENERWHSPTAAAKTRCIECPHAEEGRWARGNPNTFIGSFQFRHLFHKIKAGVRCVMLGAPSKANNKSQASRALFTRVHVRVCYHPGIQHYCLSLIGSLPPFFLFMLFD